MALDEWECYAASSRLKTKRQKKRLQKLDSDKQLIRIYAELTRLWKEEKNLGYKELVPPIQRGWKRFFVLKPDVETGRDCEFFKTLLDKINTEQYSHRRDFKKKKRRKGRKVYVIREQSLCEFYEFAFRRLNLSEREKLFFTEKEELDKKGKLYKKYVFAEPWRYMLRVRPNMITQVKVIDTALQQKRAEINTFLERRNLKPRLDKLLHGHHKYYDWGNDTMKKKYSALLKTKSIKYLMEDYLNEKTNEQTKN